MDEKTSLKLELDLLQKLQEGKNSGETEGWIPAEEIEEEFGVRG